MMLHSKKAREMTDHINSSEVQAQISKIAEEIDKAVKNGKNGINLKCVLGEGYKLLDGTYWCLVANEYQIKEQVVSW